MLIYFQSYTLRSTDHLRSMPQKLPDQSVEDTLIQLMEYNEPVVFLGDGVPVYKEEILEKMGDLAIFAPAHANRQRAAAVGTLAQVYFAQGIYESADEFVPEYLRKSQAELMKQKCANSHFPYKWNHCDPM